MDVINNIVGTLSDDPPITTIDYVLTVGMYFFIGFVVWFLAGISTESTKAGSPQRWWLTVVGTGWLIWPITIPVMLIVGLVFILLAMTVDAWSWRKDES